MSLDARLTQVADATTQDEQTSSETPQVYTVSQILQDLKSGLDRISIRKKYGWTIAEAKLVFGHPKLKSIRVKRSKVVKIQLIDDTTTQVELDTAIENSSKETTYEPVDSMYIDNQTEIQD